MSENKTAIEALRCVIEVIQEDIAGEQETWAETLKVREESVKEFYKACKDLEELSKPENPNHARIFRIPFASAKMYYQVKDGPLYYCNNVSVETIGALSWVNGEHFQMETPGEGGVVKLEMRVVTETPTCTEIALCHGDEEDTFTLEVDMARALCSTFHKLPDGFVPSFDVKTEDDCLPTFNTTSWVQA